MYDKRAKKLLKRKAKKKLQAKKSIIAKTKKAELMVGRINLGVKTSSEDFLQTLQSPDIPESEWHPDDKEKILEGIKQAEMSSGRKATVKRRPDGSFTVMSVPEIEKFR